MDVKLERTGDVFVLDMGEGENRFNPTSLAQLNEAIDTVEAATTGDDREQVALVTTATGKIFSNGIDLEWMMSDAADDVEGFIRDMQGVWARVMSLPIPTVAAVNGHAFAGGAMFTLAHDRIVMRADRGFWCVNEALLGMPFTPGMQAILTARLTGPTARKAMLTAHRFGGDDAVAASIADEAHADAEVRPRAIELAQSLAPTANPIIGRLKEDLYAATLATLREGASPAPF